MDSTQQQSELSQKTSFSDLGLDALAQEVADIVCSSDVDTAAPADPLSNVEAGSESNFDDFLNFTGENLDLFPNIARGLTAHQPDFEQMLAQAETADPVPMEGETAVAPIACDTTFNMNDLFNDEFLGLGNVAPDKPALTTAPTNLTAVPKSEIAPPATIATAMSIGLTAPDADKPREGNGSEWLLQQPTNLAREPAGLLQPMPQNFMANPPFQPQNEQDEAFLTALAQLQAQPDMLFPVADQFAPQVDPTHPMYPNQMAPSAPMYPNQITPVAPMHTQQMGPPAFYPQRNAGAQAGRVSKPRYYHRREPKPKPKKQPNPHPTRGEILKYDVNRPWVKVNTTAGLNTTRAKRINQFKPEEVYGKHASPFSNWSSSNGHVFKYTEDGELEKPDFKASAIKDFIYEHPKMQDAKLTLWIQRCPADSARRYPTAGSSKCRFRSCPAHRLGYHGTIVHGHYRVAFDEKWRTNKDEADPMVCAGYVHLYCLERFLNFPDICSLKHVSVRVDERELSKEPKGRWAASLMYMDAIVAEDFLKSIKNGEFYHKYPNYPRHEGRYVNEPKPGHEFTLNAMMQREKNQSRTAAQRAASKPSAIANTEGDLEVFLVNRGNRSKTEKYRQNVVQRAKSGTPAKPTISALGKRKAFEEDEEDGMFDSDFLEDWDSDKIKDEDEDEDDGLFVPERPSKRAHR
jgi:hypothetical protein